MSQSNTRYPKSWTRSALTTISSMSIRRCQCRRTTCTGHSNRQSSCEKTRLFKSSLGSKSSRWAMSTCSLWPRRRGARRSSINGSIEIAPKPDHLAKRWKKCRSSCSRNRTRSCRSWTSARLRKCIQTENWLMKLVSWLKSRRWWIKKAKGCQTLLSSSCHLSSLSRSPQKPVCSSGSCRGTTVQGRAGS